MLFNAACTVTVQIEIGMVGQVDNGLLVTGSMVMQSQLILFTQRVGYGYLLIAWKSQLPILILQRKCHAVLSYLRIPESLMESQLLMGM